MSSSSKKKVVVTHSTHFFFFHVVCLLCFMKIHFLECVNSLNFAVETVRLIIVFKGAKQRL